MSAGPFKLVLTRKAEKDLKKLRHDLKSALQQIKTLETDPFRGELLKGTLQGVRSLHFSLKGGGQYRAVYVILPDDTICIVFLIASRENAYDEAERRFKGLED